MFMDSHGAFVKVRIFERVVGEVDLAWAVAPAPRDPIWWGATETKQFTHVLFARYPFWLKWTRLII